MFPVQFYGRETTAEGGDELCFPRSDNCKAARPHLNFSVPRPQLSSSHSVKNLLNLMADGELLWCSKALWPSASPTVSKLSPILNGGRRCPRVSTELTAVQGATAGALVWYLEQPLMNYSGFKGTAKCLAHRRCSVEGSCASYFHYDTQAIILSWNFLVNAWQFKHFNIKITEDSGH